jgi:serine-type D-Ala-D-Ala carboxypeptidase
MTSRFCGAHVLCVATLVAAPIAAQPSRAQLHSRLQAILAAAHADSAFPGAIAVIGQRSGVLTSVTAGRIDWERGAAAPNMETVWDLASLTKVVGTTSAVMQLVERGRIVLDAPIGRYLPEWTGAGDSAVTVRRLLTHSAGLPSWRALYKEATSPDDARAIALGTAADTAPGARTLYSDLDFIFLGLIVERVSGQPLDRYLDTNVFGPIGMTSTRFRPPAEWRARIAPTEIDPWRQRHLRGEVHDENAYSLGGVSGHAGLFSSAADLTRFAQAYLRWGRTASARVWDSTTVTQFITSQSNPAPRRALGWEVPTGGNSAGTRLRNADQAFGHTGFTGTSLWISPKDDLFILLLTNRVNPTRENRRIGAVRVAVADAVMAWRRGPERPAAGGSREARDRALKARGSGAMIQR